jgi:hypothetical protein
MKATQVADYGLASADGRSLSFYDDGFSHKFLRLKFHYWKPGTITHQQAICFGRRKRPALNANLAAYSQREV